jgi:Fe-S oxidoreductase/FAD/FMN-containing dehydrogenase
MDFSKYMHELTERNLEEGWVRVQPGSNLALLNNQLKRNGLMFGPDPSSGDRATIGGVVANNSSGAHSTMYGMTADHIIELDVILANGTRLTLNRESLAHEGQDTDLGRLMSRLLEFQATHREKIERDFPKHWRRATGYSLDVFTQPTFNPALLVAGSEGTIATITSAKLRVVPLPAFTGLAILQFDDLVESMAATTTILETEPSAIELMDRLLIELTRSQPGYAAQIANIKGNPEAVLAVEYYGTSAAEVSDRLDHLTWLLNSRGIRMSVPVQRMTDPKEQADVWSVRKAGLGLLMSIRGDAKPIAAIEDVAVPVEHLAEYVGEIKRLSEQHGTVSAYYAHAASGCLHIRPLINLKDAAGIRSMDEITRSAADLAIRFGGVMSGEHGDGLQRSELNEMLFGPELYAAMQEFKGIFDPQGLMNPGKIVDAPKMVDNLRFGATYQMQPIKTFLDFTPEGGFDRAVEMCNGAGVCRKTGSGTMCPSYMATRDENDTTRARANALRNALAGRALFTSDDFTSKEVYQVMDLCLSCKACSTECPSSVNMAKIKTEFLAHYLEEHGVDRRTRVFADIHKQSKLAAKAPRIANAAMRSPLAKIAMTKIGIHPERTPSAFATETFEQWWALHMQRRESQRAAGTLPPTRGRVVYFHDTFSTYNFPRAGRASVRLLEAAGFEVVVLARRSCCGRPMLSKGLVEEARALARANVELLAPYARQGMPIVGSEPSCILTLREEYHDLLPNDDDAQAVGAKVKMIDEFLAELAAAGDLGITWRENAAPREVLFHGHCHQKATIGMGPSMRILKAAGVAASESGAGCCGMAGSFGFETEHYDVSRKVGEERLFPKVRQTAPTATVAVAGVSCRQQIEHFTGREVLHIAEVLAEQVQPGHRWAPETAKA